MSYLVYLPTLNAILNATAGLLIVSAYLLIRTGNRKAHKIVMLTATGVSAVFLTSYLIYHAQVGSRPFVGTGAIRTVYFSILLTHTVLAVTVVPLVLTTLLRGLRGQFDRHRPLARWTLPIWLYVSITGVIIYVMLYRIDYA